MWTTAKIILITGNFPLYDKYGYPTEETEYVVSHGIDEKTLRNVTVPCVHPSELGAQRDSEGWYILKGDKW